MLQIASILSLGYKEDKKKMIFLQQNPILQRFGVYISFYNKKGFLQKKKTKNPMPLTRLTTHLGRVKTNPSNYYIPNKKPSQL